MFPFPSLMAILFPSHFPHYQNFFPHPPQPHTHQAIPISHPIPSHITSYLHLPTSTKNDLQLIPVCMVLNKLAKLQTDKCNNILSKTESLKSRTCHRIHCDCEDTANCRPSRQKAINRTSPMIGSRFFLPLPHDFWQLNSHAAGLSLILSPHLQYFPRFPAAFPRKITHAGLYSVV